MPIVQKEMDAMIKQYGPQKGKEVYFALEAKRKAVKAKIDAKKSKK